ncbi:MAG: zf-HC2 domain-containing protein [Deltaproteobacteria bacterium]|nr:zf-HC2 domain-containing protein [Deltaproteobacteria bacterium]
MSTQPDTVHEAHRLGALLDGRLAAGEQDSVRAHLATCAACADELKLLGEARALLPALTAFEARPGFAAKVAIHADEARGRSIFARFRWAFGGVLLAGTAALALLLFLSPRQAADDRAGLIASNDFAVAQKLDLLEDLPVMQNQEALEDLEVVESLHLLGTAQ